MQLRTARLCLDCEEIHTEQQCPICASETFTFITRWVPAPERRQRTRPSTSPEADIYRHLVREDHNSSAGGRLLKGGVVGLTALGLLGWFWRKRQEKSDT
jgi:hypothetical protein